jgi:transcriptional regulator with XRE-family HTH domain
MELSKILKKLFQERGITITHVAKKTGIAQQTIHNWLSGTEPRSLTQVKKVADYFDVSVDYLCFGIRPNIKPTFEEFNEEINAGVFEVVLRRIKK